MEQQGNTNNDIFTYVLTSALLFVAAFWFTILNLTNIAMLVVSYTLIAMTLSIGGAILLYKAVKKDPSRIRKV